MNYYFNKIENSDIEKLNYITLVIEMPLKS